MHVLSDILANSGADYRPRELDKKLLVREGQLTEDNDKRNKG